MDINESSQQKKHSKKKWLALGLIILLGAVAVMLLSNKESNKASAIESFGELEIPSEADNATDSTSSVQTDAEKPLQIEQKELTKSERTEVMTAVIDAAKQDVAHAKKQLAEAKATGDTAKAAEAQARLANMQTVLKQALEKHDDLGLTYPKELLEGS